MYPVMSPKPAGAALEALTHGHNHPLGAVYDAMRVYIPATRKNDHENEARRKGRMEWSISMNTQVDPNLTLVGSQREWVYPEAVAVIDEVFGANGCDQLEHLATIYQPEDNAVLDDLFLQHCAVLLKAGWTQDDHWIWWTNGNQVDLALAADWVSRWDLASLNACAAARYRTNELRTLVKATHLPDPSAVALMVALLHPKGLG